MRCWKKGTDEPRGYIERAMDIMAILIMVPIIVVNVQVRLVVRCCQEDTPVIGEQLIELMKQAAPITDRYMFYERKGQNGIESHIGREIEYVACLVPQGEGLIKWRDVEGQPSIRTVEFAHAFFMPTMKDTGIETADL